MTDKRVHVSLTSEDQAIVTHGYPWSDANPCPNPDKARWWGVLWGESERLADADVRLMCWLTAHAADIRRWLPVEHYIALVHIQMRGDPEWPLGHLILDLT